MLALGQKSLGAFESGLWSSDHESVLQNCVLSWEQSWASRAILVKIPACNPANKKMFPLLSMSLSL